MSVSPFGALRRERRAGNALVSCDSAVVLHEPMKITVLGAAGTVTGSKYLVETPTARLLLDCGLFQGGKSLRDRNWAAPDFDPHSLDAVVLTHAHIDHSGYLPRLCKAGFRGPVYCTSGTEDLLRILLPDSGHLQEEEARHANKWGWSKHRPAIPLYTHEDAVSCLSQLRPVQFASPLEVAKGVEAYFGRAGHIVGSAWVRLTSGGHHITFSGDVGRPIDPIMKPPAPLLETDVLVIESTYGDRRHPPAAPIDELGRVLEETFARGGAALVPAFAVGRSQHILQLVARLRSAGRIPDVPVFLDSPMAIDATRIFCHNHDDHRISDEECHAMCRVAEYCNSPEQSKAIDKRSGPMLIISASGMATGGRILHHLRCFLPGEQNTVILAGFQAVGTRGRSLADGAKTVKIFGEHVDVRAHVEQISALSAHADYHELLAWLHTSEIKPRQVFVTHGEPAAAEAFRQRLEDQFGWEAIVARDGAVHALTGNG